MRSAVWFLLVLLLPFGMRAQDDVEVADSMTVESVPDSAIYVDDASEEYEEESEQEIVIGQSEELNRPSQRIWSDEQWKRRTGEPDYRNPDDPKPKPAKEEEENDSVTTEPEADSNWLAELFESRLIQIVLFSTLIIALLYFIVNFMSQQVERKNRKLGSIDGYSIESLEENLEESDLDRYLKYALEAGDFKSAIRIFYLAIIKTLHERRWIRWKREKTNFDYVFEMRSSSYHKRFRDMTRAFEMVWYGDLEVTEREYRVMETEFRKFLEEIDGRKEK